MSDNCLHLLDDYGDAVPKHEGVRQIVDVLTRTSKVNKLTDLCKRLIIRNGFLQKVLYGFDIMIRGALDFLYGFSHVGRKAPY